MIRSAAWAWTISVALLGAAAAWAAGGEPVDVTSPEAHLGRPVGGDFTLTDWEETSSYLIRLGEESPNVITQKVGTTTEGRDFLISIISSEANLNDLDAIKANSRILADPRGRSAEEIERAANDGRVTLFVSCAMHANECAGVQFGMEFAYTLATSEDEPWKSARERMVTVLYMTNPDGIDHVTQWYRQTVGTPHEGADLLKLYQYYSGHDNNRDWFMLTQNETRIVTKMLYTEWFPQVYWDVHQQGSTTERLFVPPYRDPLNPNLDPNIITGIDALGSRALLDLTREGITGVSSGVSYDMWWNGGNRNVPVRHNIIGILTEAASANLGSPVFLPINRLSSPVGGAYAPSNRFPMPWPGGWWRVRDIIDYEMAFGRSLLGSLSREPGFWMRNAAEAAQRAIAAAEEGAPRAWIIPSDNRDPDAVTRFVDVLLATGVELHVSDEAIEADGRTYPAGSIVIQRQQPYGTHVKDLMEVQRYPDGDPPYDVAGWTLPYLLGVRRVEVMQPLDAPVRRVMTIGEAMTRFFGDVRGQFGDPAPISSWSSRGWEKLATSLSGGQKWQFVTTGEDAGLFWRDDGTAVEGASVIKLDRLPRIGLYSPWSGSMDEGWMRYVLDTWEIPYVPVRNEMIRAGQLDDFLDVLIIADVGARQLDDGRSPGSLPEEYTRGLSPEGAVAIEEFVRGGGTLITFDGSSQWAIDLLQLPLVDVTRGADAKGFSCPGSVLRAIADESPLTAGLPDSIALFFSGSAAYRMMNGKEREDAGIETHSDVETLMHYAPTRVLLSGWIKSPEVIQNQGAWMRAAHGKGRVHLFAFRPQYRGWSQGTFPLVFRAALLDR